MKVFIKGMEYDIDEKAVFEKWKLILDTIGFYNERVKKFASLFCEIHGIKQKRDLVNPKNLLAVNLMALSKIDIDDDKTIQYSDDENTIKDYISPVVLESNENSFNSMSSEALDLVTDSISDLINERMSYYQNLYIEDIVSDIETDVIDNIVHVKLFSKFGND